MKKTSIALAVFAVVLFAVQASAQTSQIEFPANNATSTVRISAQTLSASGAAAPLAFAGTLAYRKYDRQPNTLTSAAFGVDSCSAVSFDVDLRTMVQTASPGWECLTTSVELVDAKTGRPVAGFTRTAACSFKLDRASADTSTTQHFTVPIPSGAPALVQVRLAMDSFLTYRKPVVTMISTARGGGSLRPGTAMH